jgi:hypothetical protein
MELDGRFHTGLARGMIVAPSRNIWRNLSVAAITFHHDDLNNVNGGNVCAVGTLYVMLGVVLARADLRFAVHADRRAGSFPQTHAGNVKTPPAWVPHVERAIGRCL